MIYDIQRFSIHDGCGIRTIVFLKGCTLRCTWCDNPESMSFDYDIMYDPSKCLLCSRCVELSPDGQISLADGKLSIDRGRISEPLQYGTICPAEALVVVGEEKPVDQIVAEIMKDSPFYRKSNGGVTISGGEPFAQEKLLLKLLKKLKELDISCYVETSLHANWEKIEPCIDYIDVFLADLKHVDAGKFKQYTGGSLGIVLDNFKKLESLQAKVIVRVPVVPTFNDTTDEMREIINFAAGLENVDEINFIPFHTLGINKYKMLSMKYAFLKKAASDDARLNEYLELATENGLVARIGG